MAPSSQEHALFVNAGNATTAQAPSHMTSYFFPLRRLSNIGSNIPVIRMKPLITRFACFAFCSSLRTTAQLCFNAGSSTELKGAKENQKRKINMTRNRTKTPIDVYNDPRPWPECNWQLVWLLMSWHCINRAYINQPTSLPSNLSAVRLLPL